MTIPTAPQHSFDRLVAVKTVATFATFVLVFPLYLAYRVQSFFLGAHRTFPGWSQLFALFPGTSGVYLRRAFYSWTIQGTDDSYVSFGTVFSTPDLRLGKRVYVGVFCALGDVELSDDVLISSHVSVINGGGQHGTERVDVPMREQPGHFPRVTIGTGAWIGERAVVMADVGKQAIVGAGSVVTRPVPDYAVAAGNPARIIRFRNESRIAEATTHCDTEALAIEAELS